MLTVELLLEMRIWNHMISFHILIYSHDRFLSPPTYFLFQHRVTHSLLQGLREEGRLGRLAQFVKLSVTHLDVKLNSDVNLDGAVVISSFNHETVIHAFIATRLHYCDTSRLQPVR